MIFVKDEGYRKAGKKNAMYAVFKCNNCANEVIGRKTMLMKKPDSLCRECTNRLHGDKVRKHGDSQNCKLYYVYKNMRSRCENKNMPNYHRYGGRGIKICKEWVESYEVFREWALSNGYYEVNKKKGDSISIDRIDNNGDYTPSNCQFIENRINSVKDRIMFSKKDEIAIKSIKSYFGLTNKKIGEIFNCGPTLISNIINNKATLKKEK